MALLVALTLLSLSAQHFTHDYVLTAQAGKRVSFFVDSSGVPTLTNRPDTYRANPEYTEVTIEYEAIVVPPRFRLGGHAPRYTKDDIALLVGRYSRQYRLDENLVYAVIQAESNFDPYAVSPLGARGLMQLMPATAAEMRVTDVYDPAQNIAGGTQYLSRLLDAFGDMDLALAAYNAGPGTVKKYGGVPPFKETQRYIRNVRAYREQFARNRAEISLRDTRARPTPLFLPVARFAYILHFNSGLTQPADKVMKKDGFYIIELMGRQYSIREELVTKVEKV